MAEEAATAIIDAPPTVGCAQCGLCCSAIALRLNLPQVRQLTKSRSQQDRSNAFFILHNWRSISPHEANRRNPRLCPQPDAAPPAIHFYQCDWYNPVTKQCMHYDRRPPVCRALPFYDKEPDAGRLAAYPECSYWRAVPEEQWPADVHPLPSPVNVC